MELEYRVAKQTKVSEESSGGGGNDPASSTQTSTSTLTGRRKPSQGGPRGFRGGVSSNRAGGETRGDSSSTSGVSGEKNTCFHGLSSGTEFVVLDSKKGADRGSSIQPHTQGYSFGVRKPKI